METKIRYFISTILLITLTITSTLPLTSPLTKGEAARRDKEEEKDYEEIFRRLNEVEAGLTPLYLAGSYGVRTLAHESGHVLFARLAGADSARIEEYRFFWGSASFTWKESPSPWQKLLAQGGGMVLTRSSAEAINILLNREMIPRWLEKVASGYYLCARFDMPNYVLKSSFDRFIRREIQPGDDVFAISNTISEFFLPPVGVPEDRARKKRRIIDLLYFTWLTTSWIDLYLDFDEIKDNFYRTAGEEFVEKESQDPSLRLGLSPMGLELFYLW